ncbi:MAG: PIN domain-containing protein [Candidatus Bathyarchaeia archaeon]
MSFVLDTCALISGLNPLQIEGEVYSVPMVLEELEWEGLAQVRLEAALASGKLILRDPTPGSEGEIMRIARELGEDVALSKADVKVLALALDLKNSGKGPVIISDDYSIQNLARRLGIRCLSLTTFGISYAFDWEFYCPACHRKYVGERETCSVCGTKLKRGVVKKAKVK